MDEGYKLKKENPRSQAGPLSKLFFGWTIKAICKGTKKELELQDLYKTQNKDRSQLLGDKLEKKWQNELINATNENRKPNYLRAVSNAFFFEFMLYGILWFIVNAIIGCVQPLALGKLISVFSKSYSDETKMEMYLYSLLVVGLVTLNVFITHHTQFGLAAIGMRIRIASSSLIYRKITRLSQKALGQTAAGQVVNILSNDVLRFDLAIIPLHSLWVMPFQIVLLSIVIWQQVGIACLAGIISMAIISLPVQGYLAKLMADYRSKISKKTDHRVKLMSEVVSGIQVIKMYAWEKPFENIIKLARAAEIKDITGVSYVRGAYGSCMVFLDRLALFFTILCYVLSGYSITPEKVYSLAQSFNILQLAMAIWYPSAISLGAEAWVSIKRIQEFLMLEERQQLGIDDINQKGVKLEGVNASWTENGKTLENININIPPGILCAIIGPVGAGKSSLLQLILGELILKSGTVQMKGEISYSSQEPWLFQSTVRNNILFGLPYEKFWYKKVVQVCALEKDFEQFPQRDKTIVGERGVSLSGGQRARINLARAVYRQADIYLMDDPLSAVDTHVGKHLFDECMVKHLKGKTRILITHQLQYLQKADLIVVINEGKVEAKGTFEELSQSKLDFTKMLVHSDQTTEKCENNLEFDFSTSIRSRKLSQISQHDTVFTEAKTLPRRASIRSVTMSEVSETYDVSECQSTEEETGNDPNSKPFKKYLLATKSITLLVCLMIVMVISQALCASVDLWVAYWTSDEQIRHFSNVTSESETISVNSIDVNNSNALNSYIYTTSLENQTKSESFPFSDIFDTVVVNNTSYKIIKTYYAIYFYTFLLGLAIVLTTSRAFFFFKMCMKSSITLHSQMFNKLLQAPMRFFDTNPSGRVLNRFSKDMGAIDELLPRVLMDTCGILLITVGILVNVCISNPYIIVAMIILGAAFLKFRTWYVASAKVIKHLEGTTKSPVFSHVNSTLAGIITIRSAKSEGILIKQFDGHQDLHTSAYYLLLGCMAGFGLWLDIICLLFIACVTFSFAVLTSFSMVNGSLVGLAISQSMILTGMLQHAMRQYAEVVNQLTSVERVLQYTSLDTEGPFETPKEQIPKGQWPTSGSIEFKNLQLQYVKEEPPVLKDLNFKILPGEKIGIVGRTGAGKSSLISALFRLAPTDGSIIIDGIETKTLGLTDLRNKISIIPQEPVLFSATLRYNLDPFDEYSDDQIWTALKQVELRDSINSLDFVVSEGGSNFSLGQRQLVCLARAALRNNKILVLDEATANVDPRTDSFIQATIRERFKDCSVLTIAHRLNTIMDSDKVLVMSFGNMMEFDHPHQLLQIPDGHFHKLVLETGPSMSSQLKDIAVAAFNDNKRVKND